MKVNRQLVEVIESIYKTEKMPIDIVIIDEGQNDEFLSFLGFIKKKDSRWVLESKKIKKALGLVYYSQACTDNKNKAHQGMSQVLSVKLESDTLKLFNPFHDSLGRFASKFGGGGAGGQATTEGGGGVSTASGSKLVDVTTKEGAIAKAKKGKMGTILKVGAGLLGVGVLGAVGLSVLRKNDDDVVLGHGDNINDLIEKGLIDPSLVEKHNENTPSPHDHPHTGQIELPEQSVLEDSVTSFPKFNSNQEAADFIADKFAEQGINIDPESIIIDETGLLTFGAKGGVYEGTYNTLSLSPDLMEGLKNGDPDAVVILAHELLHSEQDPGTIAGLGFAFDTDQNFKRGYIEGQNELLTQVAMNKMTNGNIQGFAYPAETQVMAGVYKALSEKTGQNSIDLLKETHQGAFDKGQQYETVLSQVFPDRVSAPVIGPNGIFYPSFPSIQEMEQWLREDYGIESEAALQEILDQAVQQ